MLWSRHLHSFAIVYAYLTIRLNDKQIVCIRIREWRDIYRSTTASFGRLAVINLLHESRRLAFGFVCVCVCVQAQDVIAAGTHIHLKCSSPHRAVRRPLECDRARYRHTCIAHKRRTRCTVLHKASDSRVDLLQHMWIHACVAYERIAEWHHFETARYKQLCALHTFLLPYLLESWSIPLIARSVASCQANHFAHDRAWAFITVVCIRNANRLCSCE